MCTVILLRTPDHPEWPLRIAANRDEMGTRPWRMPARHWSNRPYICAGLDCLAGGSWFGMNDFGVGAVVLNRRGSTQREYRSRGELVLLSLDNKNLNNAFLALQRTNLYAYRPFNLIVFDAYHAFVISRRNTSTLSIQSIPEGLSMMTASDLNDRNHPRVGRFYERFQNTPWSQWHTLLAEAPSAQDQNPEHAMCFTLPNGFGTLCSSMLSLPHPENFKRPLWLFSHGPPGSVPWQEIEDTRAGNTSCGHPLSNI